MKKRRLTGMLAVGLSFMLLSGCNGENKKTYEQAQKDLEQGSYDYSLTEYQTLISNEYKMASSLRGAGISSLRLGNYQDAIAYFTQALDNEKMNKAMTKEILTYRATAELKDGQTDSAMADCQTLDADYEMDGDTYYLTGCVALAMNAYDEASLNFTKAYGSDSSYDMALEIYEAYLQYDMEADGSSYLETALSAEPKNADDYCSRGKIYYYMEDYENAKAELTTAVEQNSTEGMLLLGMVYMAQDDTANARTYYRQYVEANSESPARGYNGLALCDMADGDYDSALQNIANGLENATTAELQDLLYNEVVVYEKKLDFTTAYSKIQEYTSMFPDDEDAQREQTFLQSRVG